jgi:ketosteroid isomerase-like protein
MSRTIAEHGEDSMRFLGTLIMASLLGASASGASTHAAADPDRNAVERTGEAIRAAFAQGDIERIMLYHHPDAIKALGFHRILNGRSAVRKDLQHTLQQFRLEFVENRIESLLVLGDTAVEQTVFAIRGIPKSTGTPFLFQGRTMVVYVRSKQSPTGWVSIRELIQPAGD